MFNFFELKLIRKTRKLKAERTSLEEAFRKELNAAAQIYTSPVFDLLSEYFLEKLEINHELTKSYNPLLPAQAAELALLMMENKVIEEFFRDMDAAKENAKQVIS